MDKNAVYLAIFAALCILAGVLVGASIGRRPGLPWPGIERPDFRERAEHFMGYGPRGFRERRGDSGGPIEMLTADLGLNAEQKTKVMQILEKMRQEIDNVGENIRSAITEIRERSDKQITDILTPAQQEKFKVLQKEFEQGCGPRGQGGDHGPMRERGMRP